MPTDPFEPLRHIDPPDQWGDISARAADGAVDVDLDDGGHRRNGRPRTRALLAVAAALVLVVGGIALARSGDGDGDEVATADTTVPASTISGACPFSLEPGPGVPTLEPAPRPVATPPAALDPPTVGVGRVGELRVAVAVSTFPPEAALGRSRWSSYEEGVAIGWLEGEDPIQVLRTGDLGLGPDLLGVSGGGRLGGADERCRDVLVQVVQPNPNASTATTNGPTTAPPTSTGPPTTAAPTTTAPSPAPADDEDPTPSTETTTTSSPAVSGSCVDSSVPCDDTVVPGDEPDPAVGDPADGDPAVAAEAEARALIEVVLGAVRFPEPAPADDGDDDTAGDSGVIVPGECPFSLDPAAGLPALEPGRSIDAPAALVAPTVGAARVGEGRAIEVAASTFPSSAVQGQDRWSSPDDAVDIGWVEPGAVGVLPSAEDLADLGVGGGATQIVQAGGHLGPDDEPCRDVLVRAYVSDGEGSGDPEASTEPFDTEAAGAEARALIEEVLQAIRFPGSEDANPPPTTAPTTAAETSAPPTTAARPPTSPDTQVVGTLTSPPGTPYTVGEDPEQGLLVTFGDLYLGGGVPRSSPDDPTPRQAGDTEYSSLYFGYFPEGADGAVLISDGGQQVDAKVSGDGRIWAAAHPSPLPFGEAPQVTIRYTFPDGRSIDMSGNT